MVASIMGDAIGCAFPLVLFEVAAIVLVPVEVTEPAAVLTLMACEAFATLMAWDALATLIELLPVDVICLRVILSHCPEPATDVKLSAGPLDARLIESDDATVIVLVPLAVMLLVPLAVMLLVPVDVMVPELVTLIELLPLVVIPVGSCASKSV